MRRRSPLAPALLCVVVVAGCELVEVTTREGDDVLVVESVLRSEWPEQTVLVHRGLRGQPEPPLEWLTAEILFPDGSARALEPAPLERCAEDVAEEAAQPRCLVLDGVEHPVVAGGSYELRVEASDGRRLFGRTRVPGPLVMVTPSQDSWPEEGAAVCALPPWTPLTLRWRPATDAWAYIAELELHGLAATLGEQAPADLPDPLVLSGLAIGASDTTLVLPGDFALFQWGSVPVEILLLLRGGLPEGVEARLVLAAADRNFVNGVRGGSFNPSGAVRIPSMVGDGTGVFGSLSTRALQIRVGEQEGASSCIS